MNYKYKIYMFVNIKNSNIRIFIQDYSLSNAKSILKETVINNKEFKLSKYD